METCVDMIEEIGKIKDAASKLERRSRRLTRSFRILLALMDNKRLRQPPFYIMRTLTRRMQKLIRAKRGTRLFIVPPRGDA